MANRDLFALANYASQNLLAETQGALDEAVAHEQLQEGAYICLSNKMKACMDGMRHDVQLAKLGTFVRMVSSAPHLAAWHFCDIWPLGRLVMVEVTTIARKNNAHHSWWVAAFDAYAKAIFADTEINVKVRMHAFANLVDIIDCRADKILSTVLREQKTCFMCHFMGDVDYADLCNFAQDVILGSPFLIVNLCDCKTHKNKFFKTLKFFARSVACACTWKNAEFAELVGPRFPRRSNRLRTRSNKDGDEEADAYASVVCGTCD